VSAFFVTATGTDIGKTFITAGLIRHLRATGQVVEAIKPVMTGYDPRQAAASDACVLLQALGREPTRQAIEAMSPWRYSAPLSPDMAAALEGKFLDVGALIAHDQAVIAAARGTLLIEGVGGIMVPLDDRHTVLDWMAALNLPLILVAGSYLGTISHTLTALDVLKRAGLHIRILIVNESPASAVPLSDTVQALARLGGIPVTSMPRHENPDAGDKIFAEIVTHLGP
jgi:dethiobiotin synthetase